MTKGNDLAQENAITRFLAKELKLVGKSPVEVDSHRQSASPSAPLEL